MKKITILFLLILLIIFSTRSILAEEKNIMSEMFLESDKLFSFHTDNYIDGKLERLMFNICEAEKNNDEELYRYLDKLVYNNYYFDSFSGNVSYLLFIKTVDILKNNKKYRKLFINNKKESIKRYIKELQHLKINNAKQFLGKAYVIEIYLRLLDGKISPEIKDEMINLYRYFSNNNVEKNMLYYFRSYTIIYYYGSWLDGSFEDEINKFNIVNDYSLENPISYLLSLEQIMDVKLKNLISQYTYGTLLNYSDMMGYKNKKSIYQLLKLVENIYPEIFIYKVEKQGKDIKLVSNELEVMLSINYASNRDQAFILSFCLYSSYKIVNFLNQSPQNITIFIENNLTIPKANLNSNIIYTRLTLDNKWNNGAITHELLHIYTNNFNDKISNNIFLIHGIINFVDYYLNNNLKAHIDMLKSDFANNRINLEDMYKMSIQEQMDYGLNKLDQQFVFFLYFLKENYGIIKIKEYINSDLSVNSLEKIFEIKIEDLNVYLIEFYNTGQPTSK